MIRKGNDRMLFNKRRTQSAPAARWDPNLQTPAIRCSICTGEQVAGFISREDGHFIAVQLINSERDLDEFRMTYGLGDRTIRKIY